MTDKIWRLPDVMARTGLSRSTIYYLISQDEFPPSINLSLRAVGWIADEIEQWIKDRIKASRPDESEKGDSSDESEE